MAIIDTKKNIMAVFFTDEKEPHNSIFLFQVSLQQFPPEHTFCDNTWVHVSNEDFFKYDNIHTECLYEISGPEYSHSNSVCNIFQSCSVW